MPCQILIKRQDNQYDPLNPDRLVWRVGDPVVCRPDGWAWGAKEDPSLSQNFYVVTISDKTVEELQPIVEALDEIDPEQPPPRLRLYEIRFSDLNPQRLNTLQTTGRLTLTFQQARSIVRNKRTGQTL